MNTGLVLEGGAMRGMYTAGVLDIFMEYDITFDGVIGVSAGAIAGCSFVSGQKGRTIRYNMKYCGDKRMMSFYSLFTTGDLVGAKFCYHDIPEKLDPFDHKAFKNSPTHFYVTCTNLETGAPEYIQLTDMKTQIDYMRASASMPYVSHTVEIGGRKLLDGGCSDPIPIEKFINMGYEKCVVILTRPADYIKTSDKSFLAPILYHKYPHFVRCLKQHADNYNRIVKDLRHREKCGEIYVIRPEFPLEIERICHDPVKIKNAYERGIQDAKNHLASLKHWLRS